MAEDLEDCCYCARQFYTKRELDEHKEKFHKNTSTKRSDIEMSGFECPPCQMEFEGARELNEHTTVHQGNNFNCTRCPRAFTSKSNLKSHLTIHSLIDFGHAIAK